MKPPINLFLATSTACNVRCKTCPAGRREREPGGTMSLEMAAGILRKATAEARVISVQLYHYNEPMLIPHIAGLVRLCHEFKLPVFLSTNLVVFTRLPEVMAETPEILLVSVSGWTQAVYERSHKDGDIEAVKANMTELGRLRRPGTHLQLSWHRYRYNEHELPLMQEYAERLGFNFVPYATSLLPHDRAMKEWRTGVADPAGEDLLLPALTVKQACFDRRNWDCLEQDQIVTVNGDGDYLNCCHRSDVANLRGSFFNSTVPALLASRKTDAACRACKAVGGHVYAMQAYTRGQWSPLRLAETVYRRLNLQGRFPRFTDWATRTFYTTSRPQTETTL